MFSIIVADEDDEIITFSSDEELIEALTHIQGNFFRVYVKGIKTLKMKFCLLISVVFCESAK